MSSNDDFPFVVVYLPKIPSSLSIIGSSVIIAEVIGDVQAARKRRHRNILPSPSAVVSSATSSSSKFVQSLTQKTGCMSRVLLSMSIGDILFSFGWFLGTWLSPPHQDDINSLMIDDFHDSMTASAAATTNDPYYGTDGSCTFQGFIIVLGLSVALLFNASLAVLYLLMVKYNWRESEERFQRVEARLQIGLWMFCLISATLPITLDMYHNTGAVCWVDAEPYGCTQSLQLGEGGDEFVEETDCLGGGNAIFVVVALQLFILSVCVIADSAIMIMIYCTIRQLEAVATSRASSSKTATPTTATTVLPMNQNNITIDIEDEACDRDDHGMRNRTSPADQPEDDETALSHNHQIHGLSGGSSSSVILRQETEDEDENSSSLQRQKKRSAIVAQRGILYITGFLITFALTFLSAVMFLATGNWHETLDRCSYFFIPLQGIWNFLVFSKHRDMQTWVGRSLKTITWDYAFGCRFWSISISSISVWTGSNPKKVGLPSSQQKSLSVLDGQHLGSELLSPIKENPQRNGYSFATTMSSKENIQDGDIEFSATDNSSRSCPSLPLPTRRNDTPPTRPFRAVSDVESSALDDNSTITVMGNDQQVPSHNNSTECTAAGGADVREHEKKKISTKSVTFAAALNNFLFFCRDESPRVVGYTNNKRGETSSTGTTTARSRHPFLSMFPQSSGTDEQKRPPNQPMRFESDTLNDSIGTPTTPTTTPNTPSTTGVDSSLTSSTRQDRSARMPPKLPVRFKSEEDNGPEDDTLNTSKPHHVTRYVANTKPPTRPLRLESETCDEEDSAATSVSRRPRFNLIGRFRNQDEALAPKLPKRIESGEE